MTAPSPSDPSRHAKSVRQGQVSFNQGDFFRAHEQWEDVWREVGGGERLVLQGLIQVAAGLHHLKEGRAGPAARLLDRGVQKLAPSDATTPLLAGLRVAALIRDVAQLLAALQAQPAAVPDLSTLRL